jgi:hypothetical protein
VPQVVEPTAEAGSWMLLDTACGECAWLVNRHTSTFMDRHRAATINLVWDQRRRGYDHFDAETGRLAAMA